MFNNYPTRISELIECLQCILQAHGDLPLRVFVQHSKSTEVHDAYVTVYDCSSVDCPADKVDGVAIVSDKLSPTQHEIIGV